VQYQDWKTGSDILAMQPHDEKYTSMVARPASFHVNRPGGRTVRKGL
jgi:hypothetical protein